MNIFPAILFTMSLVIPFAAFMIALFVRNEKISQVVHGLLIFSGIVGIAGVIIHVLSGSSDVVVDPLFHLNLSVRDLTPFFLVLVNLGTILTSIFALDYVKRYRAVYAPRWLNAATALFVFGMLATVLSTTVIGFLLSWEIMSIAAYFLVIADRKPESIRAGFLYLLMTHMGFLAITAGFLILSNGDPYATWTVLTKTAQGLSGTELSLAFVLFFAGFGSKAGLVPLHQWLPLAHSQAPSHSSALLSGVMLKIALFGFLQSLSLFPSFESWWAIVIIVIGLLSALFGVIHAAVEGDMKRMFAWSSIENMGLIFSAIGVWLAFMEFGSLSAARALGGAFMLFVLFHAFNHMLFKTGLFMSSGAITAFAHSRKLDDLGGLAQKWPLFSGIALFLSLGAGALPPLGTFFGEWLYVQSLAVTIVTMPTPIGVAAILILGAVGLVVGLSIFAYVNFFASVFLGRARTTHAEHAEGKMPALLIIPPALSVFGLLLSGPLLIPFLRGSSVFDQTLMFHETASLNPAYLLLLTLVVIVIGWLLLNALRLCMRVTDTWDCGQPLTPRMEYTATGFSAPVRFFFRSIVLSRKEMVVEPIVGTNPWIATRRLEWSVSSLWDVMIYRPVGSALLWFAAIMKRLQGGVVQVYLLLVVLALIFTLFIAL